MNMMMNLNEGAGPSTAQRALNVKRDFTFPHTKESIEVITYKNNDGSNRSECVFMKLRNVFDEINDKLLSFITDSKATRFNAILRNPKTFVITEIEDGPDGKPNFQSEREIHVLSDEQIDMIKDLVIIGVGEAAELFASYYQGRRDANGITDMMKTGNNDLAILLRFSIGAKVRYLEDLASMYLGLNCQTYFDVIAHITLTGAYTLSSLFSTTGLYHAAHGKLTGKEMLVGACRKVLNDESVQVRRNEIHTASGLIISYLRQIRLRVKQNRGGRVDDNVSFEPILLTNEFGLTNGELKNVDVIIPPKQSASVDLNAQYLKIQHKKILKFKGDVKVIEVMEHLIRVIEQNNFSNLFKEISTVKIGSFVKILQYLRETPLFNTLTPLSDYIYMENVDFVVNKIFGIEEFRGKHKQCILEVAPYFLALLDANGSDDETTIVERFKIEVDPVDIVQDLVASFLTLV